MHDENLKPDFLAEWENLSEGKSLPSKLKAYRKFFCKWVGSRFDMLGKKVVKMREKRQQLMEKNHLISSHETLAISHEIEKTVERVPIGNNELE